MNGIEPRSTGELQLYKVLKRANLLGYYDTFISQGGDDVQQLCEAGEEEFLEIMSLVGMASKPLHVRRFQKALQEWVTSPHVFKNMSDIKITSHSSFAPSSSHSKSSDLYQRPSSVPNATNHHQKSRHTLDKQTRIPVKRPMPNETDRLQEILSQKLDEKTILLVAKFAQVEAEERFPNRCSFEQAVEQIKANKKRPNLVRILLESKSSEARNKEIRRHASLFPVQFSDRFTNTPLSLFELMCNEAAVHLCQIHPLLLVADRAERLEAAQSVVRKVERETQQTQRSRLDLSSNGKFPGQADEIIAKLNEVKVKQDAFKQKIVAAEASKKYVHLLEYQSELNRLKQEEQHLMRQKAKILTQSGMLTGDLSRKNRKITDAKNHVETESSFALDRTSTPPPQLGLQSTLLADLARAHNVFDSDLVLENSANSSNEASSSDRTIKQEVIDATLRSLVTKELSKPSEAIPLMKKAKLNS